MVSIDQGLSEVLPNSANSTSDEKSADLLSLIAKALQTAIASLPAEDRVLVRLAYLHRVPQKSIASVWGWHESKISRTIHRALEKVRQTTMEELNRLDPHLELKWQDLLSFCQLHPDELWE